MPRFDYAQRGIVFLFLLFFTTIGFSQSLKHELRGVWISTASGEWPKSTDVTEQQRSLIEMFDILKKNNFNAVFFQVRPRGNALYRSSVEPWASQLTGVLGKDPGYDPLEFAVAEAHKRGLELHAWFNVAKVWGTDVLPINQQHVTRTHRDWVKLYENEWWIDMGIPDARAYTEQLAKDLIHSYDIDGIHFDYIRYPSDSFDDWKTFTQWGGGTERAEWRRNNITAFVRDMYGFVQKEKPWVKVGSAPLGIYQSINGAQSSFTGYSGVFQDSRRWLREGIHDYLVPQLYWTIGEQKNPNDPDFAALSSDWVRENYQRHIYVGIGAYRENIQNEVREQVLLSREEGAQGQVYFRYENVASIIDRFGVIYKSPALVPPMAWKDSIPPNAPNDITVRNVQGNFVVEWKEPDAAGDREKPFWYVVYRSNTKKIDTHRAENIAAILPSTQRTFRDDQSNGNEYFYAVLAIDRAGNESGEQVTTVSDIQRIFARYEKPKPKIFLSQNVPNPANGRTYITIDLPVRMPVKISFFSGSERNENTVVNETKEAGIHIIAVDTKSIVAGPVEYQLSAGDTVITRMMDKK